MTLQRLLLALAALAAIALFASLGSWQLGRAAFKEQRAQATAVALAAAPRPLAQVLAAEAPLLPARVQARAGRYVDGAVLLDNQVRGRRNGMRVYRAWQSAAGPAVLVDLGWIPWPPDRQLPDLPAPPAGAKPHGLLLPWPGQALALAPLPPRPRSGAWLVPRLERATLAAGLSVALHDSVLQLAADAGHGHDAGAGPRADPMPPERHRGYALQWFALAALVAIVYGVLAWKHRRR